MRKRHRIVGCYTEGDYEKEANEKLIRSVKILDLSHEIRPIPNRGTWVLNNSACQLYLRKLDLEMPNVDFIYCDVDGFFHTNPWPMVKDLDCDIAVHYMPGKINKNVTHLCSGTIYLPATKNRRKLLNEWIAENERFPNIWDQKNLENLLKRSEDYVLHKMPPEWCFIFDLHRVLFPETVPVCEHFQASRRYKRFVKKLG